MSKGKRIGHWLLLLGHWIYTVMCIGVIVMVWWGDFDAQAYKYLGIIGVWGLKILTTLVFLFLWFIAILGIGDELRKLGWIVDEGEDADKKEA